MAAAHTDLAIYSGDDALNLAWLALGAVGLVSVVGHVAGQRLAELLAAVDKGDLEYAREIDRSLLPAVDAIMTADPGLVMAKAALQLLGLLANRHVRAPHLPGHGRSGRRAAPRSRRGPPDGGRRPMSHPHPELTAPRRLPANGLRVLPLGGLGEVGRNMTVLEHRGRLLIIDCGVLFPDETQPGVDLILPDFEPIRRRLDRRRGGRAHPRPRGPHRRRPVPAA